MLTIVLKMSGLANCFVLVDVAVSIDGSGTIFVLGLAMSK